MREGLWPCVAGAVEAVCGDLDGPLLELLTAIEDALDERAARAASR